MTFKINKHMANLLRYGPADRVGNQGSPTTPPLNIHNLKIMLN